MVVSCGQINIFLGSLDALSSDFLKFLCVKDRKPGEGPRLPPTLPQKKN